MRLKPALSAGDALRLLSASASLVWGPARAEAIAPQLALAADAMAVVAAVDMPDETEPLFGEDIGLDPVIPADGASP